jgi:hypothetical protein
MADVIADDFVDAQYQKEGEEEEIGARFNKLGHHNKDEGKDEGTVALTDFVGGQYDDQQVATSWVCEYCEVENGLDTTTCLGCGYDYAAVDVVSE